MANSAARAEASGRESRAAEKMLGGFMGMVEWVFSRKTANSEKLHQISRPRE